MPHSKRSPSALSLYSDMLSLSYQSSSARSSAHRGGHRADGADRGAAGAVGQRGNPHGHTLALLGLGRAGGGEADADHLVDRSKQTELGETLKVSAGGEEAR